MSFTPNDTRIYVQGFPARQIISLLCDGFCRIFFFPVAYQRDDPPLSGGSEVNYSTGMFCRVLTDRYRRYFTSVSTDRSPQFSSVRPQYPTEISQNVRYSPSTLQRFYRKFGTLPVPYRDFTDSSVLLQYPTEKFCSVRPQHPTEISQIVRYSSSTLQRFHR